MKKTLLLYAKGIAMGAVDVVPGFSGGTVALITGIYDKLLASFAAMPEAIMLFFRGRIKDAWQACNASFLLVVMLGILSSIFTLARAISYLMNEHPVPLWAFFFGLVLVSVYLVGREVSAWRTNRLVGFAIGLVFALWITLAVPMQLSADPLMLFIAGAIAISAMILPGISGSFILVLLGLYPVVLGAVKNFDLTVLAIFCAGCVLGLLMFSKVLSWLLAHMRDLTMAFLAGLMLGSLVKVWPWKQTLTWQTNRHGESFPLEQVNLLPWQFTEVSGDDAQLLLAITLSCCAIALVLGVEWLARRRQLEEV
ncbi:DUF368 domain-containing protein [Pseudomonas sp. MM211]|uniref:DUF368 domain-containing protein n=1 Tax=Pseudomonas sp. MM211 TaxID=2866808 RepID=UPI001CED33B0|nr:DUF368 domain-containing protein [Pseudomonas sp. MM211]UCJ16581.1 DUF368 domain-containing protein [Pseudomonas sp. MM211]